MYVRLRDAPVASSVEVDDDFVVDLSADSEVVGIEVLALPTTAQALSVVGQDFGFVEMLDRIWFAIQAKQPGGATRSGMSVSYTMDFPFGNLPLATGASGPSLDVEPHEFELIA